MSLIKKVSIVLVCLMVFSFCVPGIAMAKDDGKGIGGRLLDPIVDLLVALGDGSYNLIHKTIVNQSESLIHIDLSMTVADILKVIGAVIVGILIAAAVIALIAWLGPIAAAVAGKVGAAIASIKGLAAVGAAISAAALSAGQILLITVGTGVIGAVSFYNKLPDAGEVNLPVYSISPEEIFSNKIAVFDVDFFNPTGTKKTETVDVNDGTGRKKQVTKYVEKYKLANGEEVELESTAGVIQSTIASWYTRLRDIAIVALLSILVYVGIRILISSTSNDKAKYKQMIMDWVIAICLLFVMQYIMSFSNIVVDKITDLVSGSVQEQVYMAYVPKESKVVDALEEMGNSKEEIESLTATFKDEDGKDKEYILWKTNLTGRIRMAITDAKGAGITDYAGYTIVFLVLIFFTIFFVFTYLKRVIYMAFLTIIAPLVAMTYPIDKINDGKAQAFNMWLKEYIFNLLIQPLHLLLYYILITSAFNLASQNIIYSLVALGFMIPAEKLMRKFFGFEKAQTPGMLAGAAGAGMVMAGMNKLLSHGPKGGSGKDGSGKGAGSADGKEESKGIRTADFDSDKYLADGDDDKMAVDTKDDLHGMGGNKPTEDASNNIPPSNKRLNEENIPEQSEQPKYTEDIIAERAQQRMKDFWETSPKAVYAKDYAQKAWNSRPVGMAKKGVKGAAKLTKAGLRKVGNSRPIKGIRNSRTWQGAKAAGRFYAHGLANKISNKVKNGHLGRKAIRMVGGAALGATAGTIGLAAGIAAGDPSKAFQYTTAGALGGYKLGSGTTNSVANALTVEGTKEKFEEGYYGEEEYKQRQLDKQIRAAQKDWEMQQFLEKKLKSKEKAKHVMENVVPDCVSQNITDHKEIYAISQMMDEGIDINKGIAIAKTRKDFAKDKDTSKLGGKEHEELNKTLLLRAKKNKYVANDDQAQQVADNTRSLLDKFSGYVHED